MRDRWRSEVDTALECVRRELTSALGVRVKIRLDPSFATQDIIVPQFTLPARLEHFAASDKRELVALQASAPEKIKAIWLRVREENPDLWSYARWQKVRLPADTQLLSAQDFAERMRQKRHGRAQEAVEAAYEAAEGSVAEEGYDWDAEDCPF